MQKAMIECSFCKNSKSQRYLYTICEHFVCVNCAALRSGQTLVCCNKSTFLEEQVKAELIIKKQLIFNNLQKGYEYERTDINKISFEQIQKKLNKINHLEDNNKTTKKQLNKFLKTEGDEETNFTPMNQFYSNIKESQRNKQRVLRQNFQVQLSTPIKLVQNAFGQQDLQQEQVNRHVSPLITLSKPSKFKIQSNKKQQFKSLKEQFAPLLIVRIDFIKKQFNQLHDHLQRMQLNMIDQVKVYFEQYVKLVEKDNSFTPMNAISIDSEKDRLTSYLDQLQQKWGLNEIKITINKQKDVHKQNNSISKNKKSPYYQIQFDKQYNLELSEQPLESYRVDYSKSNRKLEANQTYFENLQFNSMRQPYNNSQNNGTCQPPTTNRNLDKIYRKLEESRSKLEERIQLHNQFMNKRCTRLTNY